MEEDEAGWMDCGTQSILLPECQNVPPRVVIFNEGGRVKGRSMGALLAAGQMLSLCLYLFLLAKTALSGSNLVENAVPIFFLTGQLADYTPFLRDGVMSVLNTIYGGGKARPQMRLVGPGRVPDVDIIITCCNERLDVILDTVIAACNIRWPRPRFTVTVSDDGKDAKLKAAIEELSSQYHNLKYFSREIAKGQHHGYKAGNLNQALRKVLGGDNPSPFFFCLDADMIPDEEILQSVVPHALRDPKVGMVGLPQVFYNIPVNDPLNENLVIGHEHDQVSRDKMSAAWCLGSGFLVRREAWEAVGGFCEGSICEDVLFGWYLNGAGWKTVHVNERLQTGLQPETFADHIKQRRRWCIGSIHNSVRVRFGLWTPQFKQMSMQQRLACVFQCPEPIIATVFKAWTWLVVTVGLALSRPLVKVADAWELVAILASFFAFVVFQRVNEYRGSRAYGMASLRRRQQTTTWLSLYLAADCMKQMVCCFCGLSALRFSVTGARKASIDERSASSRPNALGRVKFLHQSDGIVWTAALFFVILGLVCLDVAGIVKAYQDWVQPGSSVDMWLALLTGPLFPGMGLERIVWFLSPVQYALFPPTMKRRHAYMYKAYPKHREGGFRPYPKYCGVKFTDDMWLMSVPYAVATVWAGVAVVLVLVHALA